MPEYATKEEVEKVQFEVEELAGMAVIGTNEPVPTSGVPHVFNIKDGAFGAKGDGVTDDTTAIEKAVSAVEAIGGGVVYAPPGVYLYSREIVPTSNCSFRGAGSHASIFKWKTGSSANYFVHGGEEQGGFTLTNPCIDVSFVDLGFDLNGNDAEFAGTLQFNLGLDGCWVQRCRFFDSKARSFTQKVGKGDGSTKTFAFTFPVNPGGEEEKGLPKKENRKPLSRSVSITDGGGQTFIDDGMGNWVTLSSPLQPQPAAPGGISYGGHTIQGILSITFPEPPPNGAEITVSYEAVRQRQHIAFLGAANIFINDNVLSHGGRIKVGRPGNRIMIHHNTVRDANDNAITVVDRLGSDNAAFGISTDIFVTSNVIRNCVLKGIYIGVDGEQQVAEALTSERVLVTDNIVTGDFASAVWVQAPKVMREVRVDRNVAKLTHAWQGDTNYALVHLTLTRPPEDESPALPSELVSVCDNVLSGGGFPLFAGIYANNLTGLTCSRNQIVDATSGRGLYLVNAITFAVFAENVIKNVNVPIDVALGEATDVVLAGNVLYGAKELVPAIRLRGTSVNRFRIHGNLISGLGFPLEANTANESTFDFVDNDLTGCKKNELTLKSYSPSTVVRQNKGYNPLGTGIVAVPGSGTSVAADIYDRDFYVTAGAAPVTMQVAGGPIVPISKETTCLVRVPAGKTITPSYAGAAPTWVVERM